MDGVLRQILQWVDDLNEQRIQLKEQHKRYLSRANTYKNIPSLKQDYSNNIQDYQNRLTDMDLCSV